MTDTGYKDRLGNPIKVGDTINCYHIFDADGNPIGKSIPRKVHYYQDLNIFGCLQDADWDHIVDLKFLHGNAYRISSTR